MNNKERVVVYLLENGYVGKENAIKQNVVNWHLGITRRDMRDIIADINGDIKTKVLVSFCNKGIYIVKDRAEIETMRNRAIRAIKRNKERVEKMDFVLDDRLYENLLGGKK